MINTKAVINVGMPQLINGRFEIIKRIGFVSEEARKMVFLAYDLKSSRRTIIVLKLFVIHDHADELLSGGREIAVHE